MQKEKDSLEYAFRYFELHANQRMTVFNFFLLISSALSGGIGASLAATNPFPLSGLFLSLLLVLLSLIFYKLDRRTCFLIKHAEAALGENERAAILADSRLVGTEPKSFEDWQKKNNFLTRGWSYSHSFMVVFICTAVLGLVGLVYSLVLLFGH